MSAVTATEEQQTANDEFLDSLTDGEQEQQDSPQQVLAKDLAKAISEVGLYLNLLDDAEIDEQAILDSLEDPELSDLETWIGDVLATVEVGGDLKANDGPLLQLPACLKPFFHLLGDAATPNTPGGPSDAFGGAPRAETPKEAKERIEAMIPTALRQLRDAESIAASRKAAHDAAKKNVDAMQDQLNQCVTELSEALTGIAGGDFQFRLPFDRVEQSAGSGQQDGSADYAATSPGQPSGAEGDEALAWAVHVLTRDQLSEKTSGQSDDKGISDAIADKLVDNHINTIGELEAHQRKVGQHWYKPLDGIGEGKAEKIAEALVELRKVYPQLVGES